MDKLKTVGFITNTQNEVMESLTLTGWNYLALKAAITAGSQNSKLYLAPDKVIEFLDSKHVPNEGGSVTSVALL